MGEKLTFPEITKTFYLTMKNLLVPVGIFWFFFDENIEVLAKQNLLGWSWLIVALLCIIPDHCCIDVFLA